jgi:uncharacterized protein (TIGR00269 family)
MPSLCDRCNENAQIFIRYSGQHLCALHFLDLIKRRIKKEARQQKVFQRGPRIGVALSGGKDSLVALKLLHEISGSFRDIEIIALTVDEGIKGYRPSSVEISEKITKELGVKWEKRSYKDLFGIDLDKMVKISSLGPCTICGILRRRALNDAALDSDLDILVTGHNLDDIAQTILMNIMSADLKRLARMGPHLTPIPGFVPRGMVLRTTPETETYLTATLLGLPIHDLECPYSEEAQRGLFRDLLLKAESETPGTRHSLLSFREQISPLIPREEINSRPCKYCSEPVMRQNGEPICKACSMLEDLGVER